MKRLLLSAALVASSGCVPWGCDAGYSNGAREGVIYKVSNEGIMLRSWESEMLVGSAASATTWSFSTRDDALGNALTAALGKTCAVSYREWLTQPWSLATSHEVLRLDCSPKAPEAKAP